MCKYRWIHTTHAKPPCGYCCFCSPSVIWSGMSSRILCEDGTFQPSALSNTLAPGHMTLLSTWNVVGVTEELNALLHARVEPFSVLSGLVTTLLDSADPDWGGSCCLVSSPGTPAPSVPTAGKRLRVFPGGSVVKNLPASATDVRDVGSIPGSRRSPWEGNSSPLQDSCLKNPMERGAQRATHHPWDLKESDMTEST